MKVRKRSIETEAVQLRWTGWSEVVDLLGDALANVHPGHAWEIPAEDALDTCGEAGPQYLALNIRTVQGQVVTVYHGEWIFPEIRGGERVPGRFYPVDPQVFRETYDIVPSVEEALRHGQEKHRDALDALKEL